MTLSRLGAVRRLKDNGRGRVYKMGRLLCKINYADGKLTFVKPQDNDVVVSYMFNVSNHGTKPKVVEMTLKSEPITAETKKLDWKPRPPTGPNPIEPGQYYGDLGTPWNNDGIICRGWSSIRMEILWTRLRKR